MARLKLLDPWTGPDAEPGETIGEHIVALVRAGNYAETAAQACGIGTTTYYRWMEQGNTDAPTVYREFREAVLTARATGETRVVVSIASAVRGGALIGEDPVVVNGQPVLDAQGRPVMSRRYAKPDARLGLEFLSRVSPTRFARREQLAVTGADGGPVRVEDATAARLAASLERFAEGRASDARVLDPPTVIDGSVVELDREPRRAIGRGDAGEDE